MEKRMRSPDRKTTRSLQGGFNTNKVIKRDRSMPITSKQTCVSKCCKPLKTLQSNSKGKGQRVELPRGELNSSVTADDPVVEVTVRTHKSKKPNGNHHKLNTDLQKPWNKLLRSRKSMGSMASFQYFDPLRTLHFLAKELQARFNKNGLDDPHMQRIVLDIQQALTRIPTEVTSESLAVPHSKLTHGLQSRKKKKQSLHSKMQSIKTDIPDDVYVQHILPVHLEDLLRLNGSQLYDETVPTEDTSVTENSLKSQARYNCSQRITYHNPIYETEKFQKQLVVGTKKLEKTYKYLELLCAQLKSEKEEAQLLLSAEKNTVKLLHEEIQQLQNEKVESNSSTIKQLMQEKNELSRQIDKLKSQLHHEHDVPYQEMKTFLQQVQLEKSYVDQENIKLKHQLTISNMEKEKYIAILNVRNNQVEDIRSEMTQLQEIVNEQLQELQHSPLVPSSSSSHSILLGNLMNLPFQHMTTTSKSNKKENDNCLESPMMKAFQKDLQNLHLFNEIPLRDWTETSFPTSLTSKIDNNIDDILKNV